MLAYQLGEGAGVRIEHSTAVDGRDVELGHSTLTRTSITRRRVSAQRNHAATSRNAASTCPMLAPQAHPLCAATSRGSRAISPPTSLFAPHPYSVILDDAPRSREALNGRVVKSGGVGREPGEELRAVEDAMALHPLRGELRAWLGGRQVHARAQADRDDRLVADASDVHAGHVQLDKGVIQPLPRLDDGAVVQLDK